MKLIPLSNGKAFAIVDEQDFADLDRFTWYIDSKDGYAFRSRDLDGTRRFVSMHRHILSLNKHDRRLSDHINGIRIDNRRSNLRIASSTQNAWNRKGNNNSTSPYKGVHFNNKPRLRSHWVAKIYKEGAVEYIGSFSSPEAAAKAYDQRALELFGTFARTNFPVAA